MDEQTSPLVGLDWPRKLKKTLEGSDRRPLLPKTFSLDWAALQDALRKAFDLNELILGNELPHWLDEEDLYTDLGDSPLSLELSALPYEGRAWWVIDNAAVKILLNWIAEKQGADGIPRNKELYEGFWRYAATQALRAFSMVAPAALSLSPAITSYQKPTGRCLAIDATLSKDQETIRGRLLISEEMRASSVRYGAQQAEPAPLTQDVPVTLRIRIGTMALNPPSWDDVQEGDLLMLDSCGWDPETHDGEALILHQERPLLRVSLENHKLKVLDYATATREHVQ